MNLNRVTYYLTVVKIKPLSKYLKISVSRRLFMSWAGEGHIFFVWGATLLPKTNSFFQIILILTGVNMIPKKQY